MPAPPSPLPAPWCRRRDINNLQTQIDNLDTQIEKWQDKMSDRIDYYTNQFTRLEQLINQMNSQSSALAGLMGG